MVHNLLSSVSPAIMCMHCHGDAKIKVSFNQTVSVLYLHYLQNYVMQDTFCDKFSILYAFIHKDFFKMVWTDNVALYTIQVTWMPFAIIHH